MEAVKILSAIRCLWRRSLTIQAAWTASDTLPAFGSHQKTWHSKCWFPVSIMKAKVWMSLPTPMNDRNRTRHSTRTSSSFWSWIKGLIITTGDSVELSISIKWEDILIQYCNSFLSVCINQACSGLGWISPSRLSPENQSFEHYHKILKCCAF